MRRDTADDQPSVSRVLAAGSSRILRQSRLSRGQAAALALSLVGAVAVGVMVQPREKATPPFADMPAAAPDTAETPRSGTGDVVHALDGLAGQIAAINDRLSDAVTRERAARDRPVPLLGSGGDVGPEHAPEASAPPVSAASAVAATVAAPRVAASFTPAARPAPGARRPSPARPRQSSPQRDAAPRPYDFAPKRFAEARLARPIRIARHARRPRRERHRGFSALRDFFLRGLRLPF